MLDERELGSYLRQATRSLFRLELQPAYDVPADRGDFPRYLAGEPGPDMEREGRWLDFLREQRASGIDRHRVRVLRAPLSDYDRYACEWGYAFNVPAGDDTRVLDLAEWSMPPEVVDHDFWLVDHERPVRMHYDDAGHFLGATVVEPSELSRYQIARDAAWHEAEPFLAWWDRHPEHHRRVMASTGQDDDQDELGRSLNAPVTLMTLRELSALLDTTQRDLFRIETLASYDTAATTSEYRRWLADEAEPDWELRRPWLDKLTEWAEQGRPRRRVRVIHDPIAQYERYACDWSYPSSVAAGELVHVLDLGEVQPPQELRDAPGDWYLIDGRDPVKMHHDADSCFVGAERIDAQHAETYRSAADALWAATEPFTQWWGRHREHHRNTNQLIR